MLAYAGGSHPLDCTWCTCQQDSLNVSARECHRQTRLHKSDEKLETNVPGIYALGDIKAIRRSRIVVMMIPDFAHEPDREGKRYHREPNGALHTFYRPAARARRMTELEARGQKRKYRVAKMR